MPLVIPYLFWVDPDILASDAGELSEQESEDETRFNWSNQNQGAWALVHDARRNARAINVWDDRDSDSD